MKRGNFKIFIYGKGRVGGTLFHSLRKNNNDVYFLCRDKNDINKFSCSFNEFANNINKYDLIILSVPDNQIEDVAKKIVISSETQKKVFICHTSGTISYKILNPLKEKGFVIFSLHPYFSFYKVRDDVLLDKIRFSVSCDVSRKKEILGFLKKIGIRAIYLSDTMKIPYHISAIFVSNFFAPLMRIAYELLKESGFKDIDASNFIFSLLESTLYNLKRYGIKNTITGPAARRDKRIMNIHKGYLKNYDRSLYRLYTELSNIIQRIY